MADLVALLQEEVSTLRERVRQLEQALAPDSIAVPLEWCLTAAEASVYRCLAARPWASKATLMVALYSDRADDGPDQKIVDVFICKLRKKLRPFGVGIATIWGQGYALSPVSSGGTQ